MPRAAFAVAVAGVVGRPGSVVGLCGVALEIFSPQTPRAPFPVLRPWCCICSKPGHRVQNGCSHPILLDLVAQDVGVVDGQAGDGKDVPRVVCART